MASEFDESDFVDRDLQAAQNSPSPATGAGAGRPPTHEELHSEVSQKQQEIAQYKSNLEKLERERAGLEELRRRQMEYHAGREEMTNHLTRGLVLLEETEFATRRDAEQMAKSLADLRDALTKVQALNHEEWTTENCTIELTRALTILENARMEWNGARLKWKVLDGALTPREDDPTAPGRIPNQFLGTQSFGQLCRLGFALTWPVALVALLILVAILMRK